MLYTNNMDKNNINSNTPTCLACARGSQGLKRSISNIADHAEVSEKALEKYLTKLAAEHGLLCLKYSNPNMVGFPDRLIVLPGNAVVWIELKSKGKKPAKVQQLRIADLRNRGHYVWIIDSREKVDELFTKYREWVETYKKHLSYRGVYETAKTAEYDLQSL